MAQAKILIVEDSEMDQKLIENTVSKFGTFKTAATGQNAMDIVKKESFDLVLLDLGLPDIDGLELLNSFRDTPVIILSAKQDTMSKVNGLNMGAEDYVEKPFNAAELTARIEARLRGSQQQEQTSVRAGNLEINAFSMKVVQVIDEENNEIELTPNEFKILYSLIKNSGDVLSREEIIKTVWPENTHIVPRNVDTHIMSIRKKLGTKSNYIKSIRSKGYLFSA